MSRATVKDTSHVDSLVKSLKKLGSNRIKVGVFGSDDSELVMIAAVHEYGVEIPVTEKMRAWFAASGYPLKKSTTKIVIPERSWLRTGFDENIDRITAKIKDLLPEVLMNQVDPDSFMNAIGMEFAGLIQKKLRAISSPPNSQMTIERKGSSNPLIDSGRLVGSIRHEIE